MTPYEKSQQMIKLLERAYLHCPKELREDIMKCLRNEGEEKKETDPRAFFQDTPLFR